MKKYSSFKKLGVSGKRGDDAKVNAAMDDMIARLACSGINYNKLKAVEKAYLITNYIGSFFYYKDGSYSAASMLAKGYGTCFAYSDLTYCMCKKAGLKKAWLTVAGRNVNHNGKIYGSQHRSVVTKIGKNYYELDSNLAFYNLASGMGAPTPDKISASYAKYLIGKTKKYKTIYDSKKR